MPRRGPHDLRAELRSPPVEPGSIRHRALCGVWRRAGIPDHRWPQLLEEANALISGDPELSETV
jgi:hypothetical protein